MGAPALLDQSGPNHSPFMQDMGDRDKPRARVKIAKSAVKPPDFGRFRHNGRPALAIRPSRGPNIESGHHLTVAGLFPVFPAVRCSSIDLA